MLFKFDIVIHWVDDLGYNKTNCLDCFNNSQVMCYTFRKNNDCNKR